MGNHYVPQSYLRGFTAPQCPDELWQFDKKTLSYSQKTASISKIAQERAFYDAQTERLLNDLVERPGNQVLDKLRSGNFSLKADERVQLAVYIATMLKRIPGHRVKGEALAPRVLRQVTSDLRKQIRELAHAGKLSGQAAQDKLEQTDAVETELASRMPINVREQIRSPWPTEAVIRLVYEMQWQFVCADDDEFFVTTDNPAFFFECYGLGRKESELTFPISSGLALFGTRRQVAHGIRIYRGTEFLKEANRRLISGALRFIYTQRRVDWVRTVAAKDKPYLNRIMW